MDTYGILILALIFVAALFVAYSFMDKLESAASDVREQQTAMGSSTLQDLYINLPPDVFVFLRFLVTGLLFLFGTSLINVFLGIFLGAIGWVVPMVILNNMRRKRIETIETQLIEALGLMGNALKSGLTLRQAIELLVKEFPPPITQEFNRVLAEERLGVDLTEAITNMSNRLDSIIVSILASGITIVKRCGGDLTEIFQNIASTIREQATIQGKLDAVTAQGRFQGMILGIMPFALMVILWFVDRNHIETLFGYQIGIWSVALVVGMVLMAQVWIRKLLDIDV
ncbi:MAG: type II secretion system F family protein [Bdellovibrionales bacterium]|nr:type II secretion system F family protein [Bdellovibrionales bacterium]